MSAALSQDDCPWKEPVVAKEAGGSWWERGGCAGDGVCSAHRACLLSGNTLRYTPFAPFSLCLL